MTNERDIKTSGKHVRMARRLVFTNTVAKQLYILVR
jgi:hypothetical protein